MDIHAHEGLRNIFRVLLAFHIIVLFFTREGSEIQLSYLLQAFLTFCYKVWPFPTMTLSDNNRMDIAGIVTKIVELTVIVFYLCEVLPKIFIWKKPVWWKFINTILITSIVVMVPLSIVGGQTFGMPYSQIKLKVMSLCLSLLLFMEIVTGRDNSKDHEDEKLTWLEKVRRNQNGYKDYFFTWEEIIEHDRRSD